MAGSKNFMDNFKGKDIKQIMYIVELLLTHLEPLCITLWLAGISTFYFNTNSDISFIIKGLTESDWFKYDIFSMWKIKQSKAFDEYQKNNKDGLKYGQWVRDKNVNSEYNSEKEFLTYKESRNAETDNLDSYINKTDKALWWCGFIGGLVFAFGMLLRLFPIVNQSSGYLKLSGLVMILTTIIYLLIQKDYESPFFKGNRDLMHKPLFVVNLVTVSILTLNSLFTLQYYTM